MDQALERRVTGGPISLGRAIIDTAPGVVEIGCTRERNFRPAPLRAEGTEQTKTQRDREFDK